jgi:hypothetical protein
VRLRHTPTGLQAIANESRSQHENRASALRRLRLELALALRSPVAVEAYEPPAALSAALAKPPGRRDPARLATLAALFDVLEAVEWRVSDAASLLGTSSAAIGRLLASEDDVWRAAAERRKAHGLAALRRGG